MGLKIKTAILQDMINRAAKGAGNNKMLPYTSFVAIDLCNGVLSMTTTDATNYLRIQEDFKTPGNDFYFVIPVDSFHKLISKTSSEYVELTPTNGTLEIIGNGKYVMELPLDEEGKPVRLAGIPEFNESVPIGKVKLSTFKLILSVNRAALAETMEVPCYTGYYFGNDAVVTTDSFKICYTGTKIFEQPILLPAELISLFSVMLEEDITVKIDNGKVLFSTHDCQIFGQALDGIENFQVDAISQMVNEDFPSMCTIPKTTFVGVLDRIGLFVTQYDRNALKMLFTPDGLMVNTQQGTGQEIIQYAGSKNFQPFTASIDIQMLRTQVAAQSNDTLELWYGSDTAIKMKSGIVTQIVALLDDEPGVEGSPVGQNGSTAD